MGLARWAGIHSDSPPPTQTGLCDQAPPDPHQSRIEWVCLDPANSSLISLLKGWKEGEGPAGLFLKQLWL